MTDNVYRAHTFEDLLNALPTFFGFVPRESVVGLVVKGERCQFGFRLRHDLPEPGHEAELAAVLAPHLERNGGDGVFVMSISADAERARRMTMALRDAMPPHRRWLSLWADAERLWTDFADHPDEGEPYELIAHHEAVVRAVAGGQVILSDRSELEDEVAAATGERRRWLDFAHIESLDRLMCRAVACDELEFFSAEQEAVRELVDRALGGERLTDGELVELAVRVRPVEVRDHEWTRINRTNAAALHAVWSAVARVAEDEVAPTSLSLTGFAAWQWGDGARAEVALGRALRIDPEYSMARLLYRTVQAGIHPDRWSQTAKSA